MYSFRLFSNSSVQRLQKYLCSQTSMSAIGLSRGDYVDGFYFICIRQLSYINLRD